MGDSATDAGSKTSDSEQHLTNHGKGKGASSHQGSPEEAVFHSHQDRQRAVRSRRPTIDVSSLVDKMDIIDPEDITLIRFIGAGERVKTKQNQTVHLHVFSANACVTNPRERNASSDYNSDTRFVGYVL